MSKLLNIWLIRIQCSSIGRKCSSIKYTYYIYISQLKTKLSINIITYSLIFCFWKINLTTHWAKEQKNTISPLCDNKDNKVVWQAGSSGNTLTSKLPYKLFPYRGFWNDVYYSIKHKVNFMFVVLRREINPKKKLYKDDLDNDEVLVGTQFYVDIQQNSMRTYTFLKFSS